MGWPPTTRSKVRSWSYASLAGSPSKRRRKPSACRPPRSNGSGARPRPGSITRSKDELADLGRSPIGNRMTPERWQQVKHLFQSVVERETSERAAFLDQACAGDPDLRRELETLLASDERAENFLEAPAAKLRTDQPAESPSGRRIGPYQIVREIGRGGMGAVYLAVRADDVYHKKVAIKVVGTGAPRGEPAARFRR